MVASFAGRANSVCAKTHRPTPISAYEMQNSMSAQIERQRATETAVHDGPLFRSLKLMLNRCRGHA